MCGIVGGIAQRNVAPLLLEGLKRLEYRGYDSAGIAVVASNGELARERTEGKVTRLENLISASGLEGTIGIGHTRWATHGKPSTNNAHPHICRGRVALVHNGIIENHETLRELQKVQEHLFTSDTDTEVIVHAIYDRLAAGQDLLAAVQETITKLEGAYALGVIDRESPDTLVAARYGSPLVIGVGIGEYFIASDVFALLPVTSRFIFLEEGDVARLRTDSLEIFDRQGRPVEREIKDSAVSGERTQLGNFRHFMQKEIHEQPSAIIETLEGRITASHLVPESFGQAAAQLFPKIERVRIIACGTSFHAGLVGKYWMERYAKIPCQVEVASEFRYRDSVVEDNTLFVTISQSGETADTLAALRKANAAGYLSTLCICNVPESSLVRESELSFMTHAGPEIGVASTKAFTTQLVALLLLVANIAKLKGLSEEQENAIVEALRTLPAGIEGLLAMDAEIKELAEHFQEREHALFLGRGDQYPIAMEGALKLKEISYIHAEAYPAGELKHGPLALVDADMPVIAVAPNDELLEKLKANLQEVSARGGQLIVFTDPATGIRETEGMRVLHVAATEKAVSPIIYSIPLQLLAYHVAVIKGTDIDQPRNLAKSVTVE
jgi:glucosamine--fructose-6-phosphate aminotransferase (isomerizing)